MRLVPFVCLVTLMACRGAEPDGDSDPDTDALADTDAPAEFDVLDPSKCATDIPFDGKGFAPTYTLPQGDDLLETQLFPLFAILERDRASLQAMDDDAALPPAAASVRGRLQGVSSCAGDLGCITEAVLLSDSEVALTRTRLIALFGGSDSALIDDHLKPSGAFMRWASDANPDLVGAAWDDEVARAKALVQSFVLGLPADARDALFTDVAAALPAQAPIWAPLAHLATAGLRHDGRDEAVRYEPIVDGENAAAVARIPTLRWDKWRFAAIVIPGQGPTDDTTALNPAGAARVDIAVARWRAGLAPFLMPSGGHVHPDRTVYAEAIEMKRYLMETHHVPEDAILVDPYARHTTTNLRDTTRMLLHYGMPVDAPVLVTSDQIQSAYIATILAPRCQSELGYVPWRALAALTINDSCVRATPDVLFMDSADELDP
jgi:hypothetical protein